MYPYGVRPLSLQPPSVAVGCDEVSKVSFKRIVSLVPCGSRLLDRVVHALELAISAIRLILVSRCLILFLGIAYRKYASRS